MKRHIQFVKVLRPGRSMKPWEVEYVAGGISMTHKYLSVVKSIAEQVENNPNAEKRIPYLITRSAVHLQQANEIRNALRHFLQDIRKEIYPSYEMVPFRIRKRRTTKYAVGSYDKTDWMHRGNVKLAEFYRLIEILHENDKL